jgi:hypothetical protein
MGEQNDIINQSSAHVNGKGRGKAWGCVSPHLRAHITGTWVTGTSGFLIASLIASALLGKR